MKHFIERLLKIGTSKDIMHIPENLLKMVERMENSTYVDMQTNSLTHSGRNEVSGNAKFHFKITKQVNVYKKQISDIYN